MDARTKLSLFAPLASALLACAACGGAREMGTADPASLVAAPAQLLAQAPAPAAARRAFMPVVKPGDGFELSEESVKEKDEKRRYEIGIAFPQMKGRPSPYAGKFNRAVRALVAREALDFKRAYGDSTGRPSVKEGAGGEAYDSLDGRYEVIHLDDDFVSLRFGLLAYGRGAAHSTQFHRVLNFDLKSGRVLSLGELFKPGAEHLQALSAYSIADLKRQDEEEHRREVARVTGEGKPASHAGLRTPDSDFRSGAGPDADNYGAWNLAAEGVVVSFAACSVLSCAEGEKEVLVPYSALGAILSGDGPAARLNTRPPR